MKRITAFCLLTLLSPAARATAAAPLGYCRQPALHGETLVFVAEGDLWRVSIADAGREATAMRLTSHLGDEGTPSIAPDGSQLAFTAEYEGPREVYVMPLAGGLPRRLTWDSARAVVCGWKGDRIVAATNRLSGLPAMQLTLIDPVSGERDVVPLAQAADGAFDDTGHRLFFTRLEFQGSHTKRYRGGTAQNIWRFDEGAAEALPLTADYPGTSATPLWWNGRVIFTSDRDGTMNLWSMAPDGSDPRQHTRHEGLDVKTPSAWGDRVAYQLGADLVLHDLRTGRDLLLDLRLSTDFDQTRERWIKKPVEYLTSAHLSPNGDRVALTARGQVFIAPRSQGRLVDVTASQRRGGPSVRYREARFMPDGATILALSDQSGEIELWTLPASGAGEPMQITTNGQVLRWEGVPSPDGAWIAHHDKNQRLSVLNVQARTERLVEENAWDRFEDLRWSPDSRWLAFVSTADNQNRQIKVFNVETGAVSPVTTDWYDSSSPVWSPDGEWLYLLSERNIDSLVRSPWGRLQPEPFFDRRGRIYHVALKAGARSPFAPEDELHRDDPTADKQKKENDEENEERTPEPASTAAPAGAEATPDGPESAAGQSAAAALAVKPVVIDLEGLPLRLQEVPIPPGNYAALSITGKRLLWLSTAAALEAEPDLMTAEIKRRDVKPKELVKGVKGYELSADGKRLLVRIKDALHIIDADQDGPAKLEDTAVNLDGWTFPLTPREEWRQMFIEAWRLERDYFYDRAMHGVDWRGMLERYRPLVDRVSTRAELSDLISQMVAELSALHTFVSGGDEREGETDIRPASLGAILRREVAAGGYRIEHLFASDPDRPELTAPLARPEVGAVEGEVIEAIDGQPLLGVEDPSIVLRNKAGRQVLLSIRAADGAASRQVIAVPITAEAEANLRYHEWEYTRRKRVEAASAGEFGYVHLRAMGASDMAEFARAFYPAFNRKGLVIDVRHNRGGNIDSWLLSRLMRKAWFYWQPRIGEPTWNMQYAFRGHIVVLCNERTASDGEAFTEGIRRLGLGHIIGTRTWGGEIWLTASNLLVDRGIATAAEFGVYGPEGAWLIEGHGVDPDQVVDNLPHATFNGSDAQLDAAIEHLRTRLAAEPVEVPSAPPHPDKSLRR